MPRGPVGVGEPMAARSQALSSGSVPSQGPASSRMDDCDRPAWNRSDGHRTGMGWHRTGAVVAVGGRRGGICTVAGATGGIFGIMLLAREDAYLLVRTDGLVVADPRGGRPSCREDASSPWRATCGSDADVGRCESGPVHGNHSRGVARRLERHRETLLGVLRRKPVRG